MNSWRNASSISRDWDIETMPDSTYQDVHFMGAFALHFGCCTALGVGFWISRAFYSSMLVSNPVLVLIILSVAECMFMIFGYSSFRQYPESCSYWTAVGRGIIAIPLGTLVNAFGAVVLGAPVGIKYLMKTIAWSSLMSFFTVVPAGCVFGSSWEDWRRIFAHSRLTGRVDCMISLPAHGAVIGAWFGAWPMPLDWERPWQEWPICVTYGAITGYVLGVLGALLCVSLFNRQNRAKVD